MRLLLIFLSFISMAATCQDKKSKTQKENPCDPNIMCTQVFVTVDLQLEGKDGQPVMLDSFYSLINGEKISPEQDDYQSKNGFYPVATDNEMPKLDFEGTEVEFIGEKNGKKVISHKMIIGKDCCHIEKVSGEEKVILDI